MKLLRVVAIAGITIVAGCSSASIGARAPAVTNMGLPASVSPALISPAPMAKTSILPASVMAVKPQTAVQDASYTQIPGSASFAAAAPDGSLWVLSTGPAGNDKYIWHYVGGTWTNISGLASRLAVGRDGTLYAINSGGGAYSYSGGTWTALGGGASDLTIDYDGSLFVLSNGNPAGTDQAVWHYSSGAWTQSNGSGVRISASWDPGSYGWLGGGSVPGGLYILNSVGGIYHEFKGTPGFTQLPGNASAIAPTLDGGVYVLGYPGNASGNSIYYFDLDSSSSAWTTQPGAGVNVATDGSTLYVISASGGIYSSPVKAAQLYTFGGSSATLSARAGQTPAAMNLAAYQGISASVQFGQVTSGSGTLTGSDALNNGDVSPNTLPADNATVGYSPIMYFSIYNPGPATISFGSLTPSFTLTKATGFGGSGPCELDVYTNNNSNQLVWQSVGVTGSVSGTTATVNAATLPPGNTVDFQPGQQGVAVACSTPG
ncbi:MAG TPA: hypothetical protein VIJ12_11210 [Candidatus Baltobacteraceae bacterium]